eukprot:scaffold467_cov366-Pavlova_lutheri.AAC.2
MNDASDGNGKHVLSAGPASRPMRACKDYTSFLATCVSMTTCAPTFPRSETEMRTGNAPLFGGNEAKRMPPFGPTARCAPAMPPFSGGTKRSECPPFLGDGPRGAAAMPPFSGGTKRSECPPFWTVDRWGGVGIPSDGSNPWVPRNG